MPAVVKPVSAGSSVGISIVRTFADLEPAIAAAFAVAERNADDQTPAVLMEEFIPGVEATVGVIDGFRGEELYALPPIEIRHSRDFFDYAAKYSSPEEKDAHGKKIAAEEIVPGNFSEKDKAELVRLARKVHAALGLRHYSRTDFIVSPRRGVYVLEVNTLPGLTEASLVPKALAAVGSNLPEFLDHIIGLALEGK
jgi:D-alanine-D-alanine ligase